ncbi:MAG: type II secretion system protein GspC [Parahaliea sp.]
MPVQWSPNSGGIVGRAINTVLYFVRRCAEPAGAQGLRRLLLLLLLLWITAALIRLFWALWPEPSPHEWQGRIINPIVQGGPTAGASPVERQPFIERPLFGTPGVAVSVDTEHEPSASLSSSRDGIEKGARETRLELVLRGIVASTDDGLGHAVIEHRSNQAVYAVDDELPVSAGVRLAKVMPGQVVLDNNGDYELLTLFDETVFDRQLRNQTGTDATTGIAKNSANRVTTHIDRRSDEQTTQLATSYRQQLYKNPQSLAELVRISAVREGGQLKGYRIMPGKAETQFARLGFKAGDLVTRVNGIVLDNPANTMQLYQAMRTAREAVFELERQGQSVSVSVDLDTTND